MAPGDPWEVRGALRAAIAHDGPVYIRIGKKGEPAIHAATPAMKPGGSIVVREGTDVCLLGVGVMLPDCLAAADRLKDHGVSARVVSFYSAKPLDTAALRSAFATMRAVTVVEEHSRINGVGTAIADWLADQPPQRARLVRLGTRDEFMHVNAHTDYARAFHGLTVEAIVDRTLAALALATT